MHNPPNDPGLCSSIQQGLLAVLEAIQREEQVDDLDVDDDFEWVELAPGGAVELLRPQCHGDPTYGDAGDPYWELGGGD